MTGAIGTGSVHVNVPIGIIAAASVSALVAPLSPTPPSQP
jgi:hypothetical protein